MSFTRDDIIAAIKTVFDPEIPVNVWDLGLIYDVAINDSRVDIKMTLTSPMCPMAEEIPQMVKLAAGQVAGAGNVSVEMVWEPMWDINKMSAQAKLELDITDEGW